jgi:hypothetical protein
MALADAIITPYKNSIGKDFNKKIEPQGPD